MEYMLLLTGDEKAAMKMTKEEGERVMQAYVKYTNDLVAAGKMRAGAPLEPTVKMASRVSVTAGKKRVVDGPFAESKEVCGGYYIIECANREEAIEWAARCPAAEHGTVEVRQIMPISMESK